MDDEANDSTPESQITRLLQQHDGVDPAQLLPLVYNQLRAMAQRELAGERRGHTLQATALVHEAWLRIVPANERSDQPGGGAGDRQWSGRTHFFRSAATAMQHILVDHARARLRHKRGGPGRRRVDLSVADALALATSENPEDVIALDEAIQRLRGEDPRAAEIVELRFYAGLSVDETAAVLGVSPRTVDLDWKFARAFLFKQLSGTDADPAPHGGAT